MALIKCPECGREISDKTSSCLNCGYKKRKLKLTKKKIIIFAICLVVIGVIFFIIKHINSSIPKGLSLTLEMTKKEVHDIIGNDFILEKDEYERDIEVYDLKWCGYDGKLSITYSLSDETINNWKWEIDISGMNNQNVEKAMIKVRDKVSKVYGAPEESNVSRLEYKWVTTHTVKAKVTIDVGYKLIREDILWLHYGEVY